MTTINAAQVTALQKEIRIALEPILKKHGLALRKNNGRYTDYEVSVKLEMALENPEAVAEAARAKFKWMFQDYGVDHGTEVHDLKGTRYTVEGFNRAGKLQAKSIKDGKTYHAEPRFFRLNGKPLESKLDRQNAENIARAAKEAK